jgi:hypothetical protein
MCDMAFGHARGRHPATLVFNAFFGAIKMSNSSSNSSTHMLAFWPT